jgi:hypothetical protein
MMAKKGPLGYEEFLVKFPDWVLVSANQFPTEATPELTERSRRRQREIVGTFLRFLQDHGLVRQVLHEDPPNIPNDFSIHLRDVTPDGLEIFRAGYLKWLESLDRNVDSDTSDTKILEKALVALRKKRELQ